MEIIAQIVYGPFLSREQAIAQGLRHYITGIACRNGHVSVRGVSKWNCLQCDSQHKANERLRDPERVRANERRTANKHRKKKAADVQSWRLRNKDRLKQYVEQRRQLYYTDPKYRARTQANYRRYWQRQRDQGTDRAIALNLRNRITVAMMRYGTTKSNSTEVLIGCSVPDLRQHLEVQFVDGMTWDNYGRIGWHIDHIRPCASFDLTDPAQQRQCFHYSNLQPLWAADNIRKGAKLL
jgi:hypothetical protein